MTRAQTAASVLMFSATLLTASLAASQDAHPARTIVLRVHDYARFSPDTLAHAQHQAARIFASAGVRLVWAHWREPLPDVEAARYLTLLLLSEKMGDRKVAAEGLEDGVLARAEKITGRAHVLSHRVARVAANYGRPLGHVLGTILAHEIGHLMLPGIGHSRTGIMCASLDPHLRSDAHARFTAEEALMMHAMLASADRDLDFGPEEHGPVLIQSGPLQ